MAVSISSALKKNHFGIEVTKLMKWDQWEPGGEYTQLMTLKNVNSKTKKLKYRISNTDFFTTRYPQPIILSSGMSIEVPITFRPLKKDKYEDAIEFVTKEGPFKVSMKAVLPEASLNFPEMIKFGMCAVKDQLSIPFQISNTSELQVNFQLKTSAPFVLNPTSGTLAAKTHCNVVAVFKPEAALVYELDAECIFGNDQIKNKISKTIKMEGIGKYIYLGISSSGKSTGHDIIMNFNDIPLGTKLEKSFTIQNLSPVDAPFQIMQKSSTVLDNVFSCSKYHGVIPAEGKEQIKLAFIPELHNLTYVENFDILAVGMTSKSSIKCIGNATGPSVSIDNDKINFGISKLSTEVTRSFKLKNNSNMDAIFQFKINSKNSVFKFNITDGIIEANSTKTVTVRFTPPKAIVYYRKVFCLIQNQEPVSIELFGTCHSNEAKPVVLSKQHLRNYSNYVQNGISRLCPEEISDLLSNDKLRFNEANLLEVIDEETDQKLTKLTRELDTFEQYFAQCQEQSDYELNKPLMITTDCETIDFGKCKEDTIIQKTINISNNTFGKVTCVWMNGDSKFKITPEEADIGGMSTLSFRVVFRPDESSKYFDDEIEAFVFYKSMRDHRLVDEVIISPPWCVTVNVMGHTFPKQKESFVPLCKWQNTSMVFPPISSLTQSVYRTCLLTNEGVNPIHYSFSADPTQVFSCKPQVDLVRGRFQLVLFRMNAMDYGTNRRNVECKMNNMEKFTEKFEMVMTAEKPDVMISPKDMLYFKPTCIGSVSHQTVSITNRSRIPLRCHWKISKVDQNILTVEPQNCLILPNEIQHHTWKFSPTSQLKHLFKTKLVVSTHDENHLESDSICKKYILRIIGEGQLGQLECNNDVIDFGDITVGDQGNRTVVIQNNSKCSLHYKLNVEQRVTSYYDNDGDNDDMDTEKIALQLDHNEFVLPSMASKPLKLKILPKRRANYQCVVSYHLVAAKDLTEDNKVGVDDYDESLRDILNTQYPLLTTNACGVYPQLQINDIRGAGCAEMYSKKFLWELFHLDHLNTLLEMEPSFDELKYQMASRHSTRRRMPVTTKAVNEFNFCSSVYGSEPCYLYINLQNTGQSSVKWAIKYPIDFQLEMEYWAETGDLSEDELHEMYVMNSELFVVTPRSGRINAGQSQTVTFVYNHTSLGTHQLPVLLKIEQGREIKLNFFGKTLEPHQHALHFSSFDHVFAPVSIGSKQPSVQSYTLFNGSSQTTRFAFDTTILDIVEKDNYEHRIYECLTPEGEIAPYQSKETLWIFSPIEARSYTVGVPLLIENNESLVITMNGSGYDPYVMGDTVKITDFEEIETLPRKQLVIAPNQLMMISSEYLQYGTIPLNSEASQLVFLTNPTEENTISFHWILKGTPAEPYVKISPISGFLKPQQTTICKVTVFSQGPSANHQFDIKCEVIDETLTAQFKCDLKEWSKRKEEKKHLFTIRDVPENKLKNNRPGSQTSKRLVSVPSASMKKYETLPPIHKGSASKSSSQERRVIVEECPSAHDDIKPLPPRSFVSHLGVGVSTHSAEECQHMISTADKLSTIFIQRNPSVAVPCNPTRIRGAASNEKHVVESILKMVLQDLIHDEDFKQAVDALEEEDVPYYAMLTPQLPPIDLNSKSADDFWMNYGSHNELEQNNNDKSVENIERYSSEDITALKDLDEKQYLKRNDEMRYLLNEVLESTINNIIIEANQGGFSLTDRPRLYAPPPPPSSDTPVLLVDGNDDDSQNAL